VALLHAVVHSLLREPKPRMLGYDPAIGDGPGRHEALTPIRVGEPLGKEVAS